MGMLAWLIGQFWPALLALAAIAAGFLGLKAKAAHDRQIGLAEARREQQEIDDAAGHRARLSAARIAGADDSELDRVRREQAAERERLMRRRG